jgi:hypothetical protein
LNDASGGVFLDYGIYIISAAFLLYVWYKAIKEYLWIFAVVLAAILGYLFFAKDDIFSFLPHMAKSFILIFVNAASIGLTACYCLSKQE